LNGYKISSSRRGAHRVSWRAFSSGAAKGCITVIDVDRLDPLLAQLEADGVRIVDRHDFRNGRKTAFISPRSAHGVLIQFWQEPF
jgi:hypothetical protein